MNNLLQIAATHPLLTVFAVVFVPLMIHVSRWTVWSMRYQRRGSRRQSEASFQRQIAAARRIGGSK